MIPKTIHYCWFGKNPLSDDARKCIASWEKCCPDYKIIQWNEDNYDVKKNRYMREAYEAKKWAFVSDYARVDIIYQHGGIYLDIDVELIKPLDGFLDDGLFAGWERKLHAENREEIPSKNCVAFGLGFGAEAGHTILRDLLALYEKLSFYNTDGTMNLVTCPYYQTDILKRYGLDTSNLSYQRLPNAVIYPASYFCPKSYATGKTVLTEDTVSIHHYTMSWNDKEIDVLRKLQWRLAGKYGYRKAHAIVWALSIPYRVNKKIKKFKIKLR